jgi:precorrin-3B methylase
MLGGIGKDAGLSAAQEAHKTVDDALKTVDEQTIPAAEQAARAIVDRAVYGAAGVVADLANRLGGAELPVDITVSATATVRVTGKIGALKLSNPESSADAQKVEVQG